MKTSTNKKTTPQEVRDDALQYKDNNNKAALLHPKAIRSDLAPPKDFPDDDKNYDSRRRGR